MDVGQLDKRVTIERKVGTRDSSGAQRDEWQKLKTVWANVRFERGMEAIRNGKDTAVKRASVRIRKRKDIDESMRVIYAKQAYQIHSILPVGDGRDFVDLVVEAKI